MSLAAPILNPATDLRPSPCFPAMVVRSWLAAQGKGFPVRCLALLRKLPTIFVALVLGDCAQMVAQQATGDARTNAADCVKELGSTPEAKLLSARLWRFDDSDTIGKLSDPNPLSKNERDALVTVYKLQQRCRQIVLVHDDKYAAWEAPYWQQFYQRSDEIFYKLASGEISVGLANKLTIESNGKFQTDLSRGHANAVQVEEVRRQQVAQAMLQTSAQVLASQPQSQVTTTNCSWVGNTLNCTSMR